MPILGKKVAKTISKVFSSCSVELMLLKVLHSTFTPAAEEYTFSQGISELDKLYINHYRVGWGGNI